MKQTRKRRGTAARQANGQRKSLSRAEKDAKAQYEQLRRRTWCLVKKSQEANRLCGVQMFMFMNDNRRGRGIAFSSERLSEAWPPRGAELVSHQVKAS